MAKFHWDNRELTVLRSKYQYGSHKQLALLAFDDADPGCTVASGIPYGVLTVNLDDPRCEPLDGEEYGMQFLDVNNWPGIEWVLNHDEDVDWAQQTNDKQRSGFVSYPIWIFDLNKIPYVWEVGNGNGE